MKHRIKIISSFSPFHAPAKSSIYRFMVFLIILLLMGCSTGSQEWYRTGAGQVEFNLDDLECRTMAEETARQATLSRQRMDPLVYADAYSNCLFSKGWTHTPPGEPSRKQSNVSPPARFQNSRLEIFGRSFDLPARMVLLTNQTVSASSVMTQSLLFQGPGPVYLNCIVQQSHGGRKFNKEDYPVPPPMVVFDQGKGKSSDGDINWTIFAGEFQPNIWVCGLGAYLLMDKFRRISLVLTRDLTSPKTMPPPGLTLTRDQNDQVTGFQESLAAPLLSGFGMVHSRN